MNEQNLTGESLNSAIAAELKKLGFGAAEDTDVETMSDPADNDFDAAVVREALRAVATEFDTVKAVRPTAACVEELLFLAGEETWSGFVAKHKKLLAEYFGEAESAEPSPQATGDRKALLAAERRRDQISAMIKAEETALKSREAQAAKIRATVAQAELEALATDGISWDSDALAANKKALAIIAQGKAALAKLEGGSDAKLKTLYGQLRVADGAIRYQQDLLDGKSRVYINTGDAKEDANLYAKLANSIGWELSRLMDREDDAEKRAAMDRYSGAEFGVARYGAIGMEDTGGGVYERGAETLVKIRDAITNHLASFEACKAGYETCVVQCNTGETWFPQFQSLGEILQTARVKRQQSAINRAKQQIGALKALAQR